MRKIAIIRKRIIIISLVVISLILSAIILISCTKNHYTPKYLTKSCELKIKDLNSSSEVSLDKRYSKESVEIYLGSDIKDNKTIDFLIENSISAYSLIKSNTLLKTDNFMIDIDAKVAKCKNLQSKSRNITLLSEICSLTRRISTYLSQKEKENHDKI